MKKEKIMRAIFPINLIMALVECLSSLEFGAGPLSLQSADWVHVAGVGPQVLRQHTAGVRSPSNIVVGYIVLVHPILTHFSKLKAGGGAKIPEL